MKVKTYLVLTLISLLFKFLLGKNLKQVPKALNLSNHFGSEPKNNYYGPHHFFNKNSFLHSVENNFSRFNLENKLYISSGKINKISLEAENIISPLLPLK